MLYRLFGRLAAGTHATGSATTRRSVNARPAGPFGEVPACAPGEWMQIDSTPLDVLVRLDEGIAEKVELTIACARLVTDRVRCAGDAEIWLDGALHKPRRRPAFNWAVLAA
ncbi:hypothetical protein [Streptomyces sp. NPDC002722]|uniref:hypothetical protein n=1 Tax=unclassified Streptomyces TaxID=2593676 RepID=UPI003322AC49